MTDLEKGIARLNEMKEFLERITTTDERVREYWRGMVHGTWGALEDIYDVNIVCDRNTHRYHLDRTDEAER